MDKEFLELIQELTIEQQIELKKIMLDMLNAHTKKIKACRIPA